ncbi:hypothetical protein [Streptomyces guryensis]|uniref:Uncharacterized protein n=1 Tax=Streptomyces guryensis TaxID=2886947 RepID=A0A9Q3VXB7_9ACTN|nr:hypothetical protein [Streptomyces guryensis]MCD9880156.1 hypothetical protein [Streptomyces guryensis]
MLHDPGGHPPDPRFRLIAMAGVVACAVALPLAVASAGPAGDEGHTVVRAPARESVRASPRHQDAKAPSVAPALPHARTASRGGTTTPLLLDLGLDTAVRCGPELTSPEGVEAQTCVLTQGEDTWGRTYYRNVTGKALDSALSLMGPGGRTVQLSCAVGAEDEPGMCETPRQRTRGALDGYTAVAEFAGQAGRGPLLLRSGSNSGRATGS